MNKRQLYADIAARHTPKGVKICPVSKEHKEVARGVAHTFPEDEDEEEDFVPWMEVPEPTTIGRLWTYLHECVHMRSSLPKILEGSNYSSSEAEADLGTLRILEAEGVRIPLRELKARRKYIEMEAERDRKDYGAERSALVIEVLVELDRRISVSEERSEK